MREDLAGIIIETDVETDGKDPRRLAFLAEEQARKDARTAVMLGPLAADAEKNAVEYERDMMYIYGASDNYNSLKHQELSDLLGKVTPLTEAEMGSSPYQETSFVYQPRYRDDDYDNLKAMQSQDNMREPEGAPIKFTSKSFEQKMMDANNGVPMTRPDFVEYNNERFEENPTTEKPQPDMMAGGPMSRNGYRHYTQEAQEARMTDQQDWDDRPKWWRERN